MPRTNQQIAKAAIKRVRDEQVIDRYCQAQASRTPEQVEEERMMARAAHGKGVKMVNIITGETYLT